MTAPDSRWKEAYALAEDLRLLLDLEALSRMRPKSLLKDCLNILVRHGLCESFWGRDGKTPFDLQGFLLRKSEVREGSGPWKQQIKDRIVAGIATSALGH